MEVKPNSGCLHKARLGWPLGEGGALDSRLHEKVLTVALWQMRYFHVDVNGVFDFRRRLMCLVTVNV